MADLRRECAKRLRRTVHGKEIDILEDTVKTPHMLGIVPIGTVLSRKAKEGTLLSHDHPFWEDFEEEVATDTAVKQKVESAIRSLRKDDIFRMTYPHGEEADIVYCEVDRLDRVGDIMLPTQCADCGEEIEVPLSLDYQDGYESGEYALDASIDCPFCDFSQMLGTTVRR